MASLIQFKNKFDPEFSAVDNMLYYIGPHTFKNEGVIEIMGVKYTGEDYKDINKIMEMRRNFDTARQQEKMWEKLSD